MTTAEYENVIGKLVLVKLYLTHNHHADVDELIEKLTVEYMERGNRNEL